MRKLINLSFSVVRSKLIHPTHKEVKWRHQSGAEKANRGANTENGDLDLSQVHLVSWPGHRVFRGRKGEKERGVGCVISL